jgi:hypothetical protein
LKWDRSFFRRQPGLPARGQDYAAAAAEADAAEAFTFAEPSEDDFVSIFEEFSLFAGGQRYWILAARGQFQQASARRLVGA